MNTQSISDLLTAYERAEADIEASTGPAEQQPSVFLIVVQPTANPNTRTRIFGDVYALGKALVKVIDDPKNPQFCRAFAVALDENDKR